MLIVVLIYILPTFWVISTSFKSEKDAFATPPKWFLFEPTLENYRMAFVDYNMLPNFKNSVIVAVGSTLLALLLGDSGGLCFVQIQF